MPNFLYNAFRQAMLEQASLLKGTETREVEYPCWHSRWARAKDRILRRPHPRTHLVTEELIKVALIDTADA